MNADSLRASDAMDLALRLLRGLGLLIAAAGLGLDLLPAASPGINLPQLSLIAAGIALFLLATWLRRARRRLGLLRYLVVAVSISALTLLVLEVAFAAAGYQTYYPPNLEAQYPDFSPWRTCDDSGCHIVLEVAFAACNNDSASWMCRLNPQGYLDTQAFTAGGDLYNRNRILVLGDSFTFGMSADAGMSYVEVLEALDSESVYWNTAIPGAGTHHAVASFQAYAPILRPQVTVLGFFMNDFENNMISLSYWDTSQDPADDAAVKWTDLWGNVIALDQRSTFHFRQEGIDPPANHIERALGGTRLGSLALRLIDAVARIKTEADGLASIEMKRAREYLGRLRDEARAAGSALLVLLIPRQSDVASPDALYQNAVQLLNELAIDALNPIALLDAKQDYAADGHWNNAGHRKIALRLYDCLNAFRRNGDFADCAAQAALAP